MAWKTCMRNIDKLTKLSYNRADNIKNLRYQPLSTSSDITPYLLIYWWKKKFMTCFMETFSYVKIFYIEFNKEIFPGDLSQTLSKSTWAKLVRNILTINYLPCTSRKLNEIQASLVFQARQVINLAGWCLMTSFMLSCVDAGLMTHNKCNDNNVAGVLPTLQLQVMMARLPRKHNGITCYSH